MNNVDRYFEQQKCRDSHHARMHGLSKRHLNAVVQDKGKLSSNCQLIIEKCLCLC